MYRCTECQTEYKEKPDYCDCGNDTFEEIVETPVVEKVVKQEVKLESVKIEEPVKPQIQPQKVEEKQVYIPKKEKVESEALKELKETFEPISTIYFLICLIISILVLLFAFNPSDKTEVSEDTTKTQQETATNVDIPSIDKLWNSSTVGVQSDSVKTTNTVQQEEKKTETVEEPKVVEQPKKKIVEKVKQKTQTKVNNVVNQAKTQTQTVKPVAKTQQTTAPKTTSSTTKPKTTTQTQPKTQTASNQDFVNYKYRLQYNLASKMDFASVVGDGSCSFSFKVLSSGIVSEKKFISTNNESLSDTVYNALLQTSAFNPPPTGYANRTFKLSVKMYNGGFEVGVY